jgi:hypothetical protein
MSASVLALAFGGSGRTFDWSLAAAFPYRAVIAGRFDGDNVAEAIRVAAPWGVVSCSRLESAPGRTDHAKVAAFVTNALAAYRTVQIRGQAPNSAWEMTEIEADGDAEFEPVPNLRAGVRRKRNI